MLKTNATPTLPPTFKDLTGLHQPIRVFKNSGLRAHCDSVTMPLTISPLGPHTFLHPHLLAGQQEKQTIKYIKLLALKQALAQHF